MKEDHITSQRQMLPAIVSVNILKMFSSFSVKDDNIMFRFLPLPPPFRTIRHHTCMIVHVHVISIHGQSKPIVLSVYIYI